MENLDQKLDQLKQEHPIMQVALELGFQFTPRNTSVAVRCFNHEDRTPSLVLQPETNSFECKSCGEKGDALTLIQKVKKCEFKDAVLSLDSNFYPDKKNERPRDIDKDVYWNSRKISDTYRAKFDLSLKDDGLYIPLPNGSIKRRNFKPYFDKRDKQWKFPKFVFFERRGKCLFYAGEPSETIFITEGELDAIKGHQETGFTFISDTTGAASFEKLYLNDPYIKGAKKIYIIPDNDEAGKKGALKTATTLGLERCYQITLPQGKDLTEYFVKNNRTGKHFKSLIADAVSMQSLHTQEVAEHVANAFDFSSMSEEEILKEAERTERLRFGIPNMDSGEGQIDIAPGLIVIAAPQGTGKSWMMLHLTRKFFENHSKRSVIISLEMTKETLKERALQSFSDLTQRQYEMGADVTKGAELLKRAQPVIQEFGLDDARKITIEELEKIVDYWYSKGCRVFQFDHLHQISGMSDGAKEKEVSDKWSMAIKALTAKYKDIWFFAYAQTTKEAGKKIVGKDGIRYGARFVDVCDMFLSLNNPASMVEGRNLAKADLEQIYNPSTNRKIFIYLSKARFSSVGSRGWNVFLSKTGNFTQTETENIQEDISLQYTRKPKTFAPLPDFPAPHSKTVEQMSMKEVEEVLL